MEDTLRIDEVEEQFNQAVDKVYDYFEQNYGVVPTVVQDALYEALEKVTDEDRRLWGEWLGYCSKVSRMDPLSEEGGTEQQEKVEQLAY